MASPREGRQELQGLIGLLTELIEIARRTNDGVTRPTRLQKPAQ